MKIKKRSILTAFFLFLICITGLAFSFMENREKQHQQMERPPRKVKTIVLGKTSRTETRTFPGLVQSSGESELSFRVGGPLIQYDIRIGQWVDKGRVIARIDPRDFIIRIEKLSAALKGARANLEALLNGARVEDIAVLEADLASARAMAEESEKNLARYEKLWNSKTIAKAQLDRAQTSHATNQARVEAVVQSLNKARKGGRLEEIEAAEAQIQQLENDLRAAQYALEDTWLRAPFSGYVNKKLAEKYEIVEANKPVVSLLDFTQIEVRAFIPEELVIRQSEFSKLVCTIEAYPGKTFGATIKEFGLKTDSANQSYPLTVALNSPGTLEIRPGMAAALSIIMKNHDTMDDGYLIPAAAVCSDSDGNPYVWSVSPEDNRVSRVNVDVASVTGDTIQVVSGLGPGQRVVTAGARYLMDGLIVDHGEITE